MTLLELSFQKKLPSKNYFIRRSVSDNLNYQDGYTKLLVYEEFKKDKDITSCFISYIRDNQIIKTDYMVNI